MFDPKVFSAADLPEGDNLKLAKAACVLLAGGEGSRLGFAGPKGAFELFPGKSLFYYFCKALHNAEARAGSRLYMAIMVSPGNEQATRDFFSQNNYFGLQEEQVRFFCQDTLPLTDMEGNPLRDESGQIVHAAAGNGAVFQALGSGGLLDFLAKAGIECLSIAPVDNPLFDPFDAKLITRHLLAQNDVTVKCVLKSQITGSVGMLYEEEGQVRIVEYLDLPKNHGLHYANTGLFCISLDFAGRLKAAPLPVRKIIKNGRIKSERFIFDMLPYSAKTECLLYSGSIFAPLKTADDLALIRTALKKTDML